MALFGTTEKTKKAVTPESTTVVSPGDIRVMPTRFRPTIRSHSGGRWWLWIGGGLIVLLLLGVILFAAGAFDRWIGPVTPAPAAPEVTTPATTPSLTTPTTPQLPTASEPTPETPATTDSTTPSPPPESPTPVATPPATPAPAVSVALGTDSDRDGLTDVEEVLYKTDPKKPDTDADGYLDGEEVSAGYNPLFVGSKLATSDLVKLYPNSRFGFTLLYPAGWRVVVSPDDENQVAFESPAGEGVELTIHEAVEQSLDRWYRTTAAPSASATITVDKTTDWDILKSPDGRTVYLKSPKTKNIYVLVHDSGGSPQLQFSATFSMMVSSLKEVL